MNGSEKIALILICKFSQHLNKEHLCKSNKCLRSLKTQSAFSLKFIYLSIKRRSNPQTVEIYQQSQLFMRHLTLRLILLI